jgi:hypothetical protein
MFWKLDLFPSSGEGETSTLLGPLERANLNHQITCCRYVGELGIDGVIILR